MRCRKLYKDLNKGNYNLVFFQSQGMDFPYEIKVSVSLDNATEDLKMIDYETYYNQEKSQKSYTLNFFDNFLSFEYNINKDSKNIRNTNIGDIHFHCDSPSKFIVSIYVISPKGKKLFIVETINITFDDDNHDYYYTKDNLDYIPFKKFGVAKKVDGNYAGKQEGVAYSLTQRLSVLKHELWYLINYGLPLLDKIRNGQILDSVIINIIMSHPDVVNIVSFNSVIRNNHEYYFNATIATIYNENIVLSNTY